MNEIMLSPEIAELSMWIQEKIETGNFGEIQTTIKVEAGKVSFVERGFIEKIKYRGVKAPKGVSYDGESKK